MRNTAAVIGGIALFLVVVFVVLILGGVIQIGASKVNAVVAKQTANNRVQTVIYDPTNVIANYEYFYTQCRAIQAKNQQVVVADDRVAELKREAAQGSDPFGQKAQAVTDAITDRTGLEQSLATAAEEYNAKSAETATRAKFKSVDLPYRVEAPYRVTCP